MTDPSQDKLMPTEEMIDAGVRAHGGHRNIGEQVAAIYTAMEAARPTTDVSTDGLVANAIRLALEDADTLDQLAEDADDNGWQEWGAMMRQSAGRTRAAIEALQRSNADIRAERDAARELLVIAAKRQAADEQHIRELEGELRLISIMQRQGPETDIQAWINLWFACNQVARKALGDKT